MSEFPSKRTFDIETYQNCILVTLRGHWDTATNISYLGELTTTLQKRNGKPFHLLVDIRAWSTPDSEIDSRIRQPIQLDRRNQLSELWLEDENTNADHIAKKYFVNEAFVLERTQDAGVFLGLASERVEPSTMAYVKSWVHAATP
ncbi:arginine decarboxylase [Alteromonas hispanica]|uniref:Arginine decarboxylase n=1 Tax=Alteromonas hispanica TaxID=315421 RepID=A0A6L9MTM8_9ALTE|nr:arginine decarboxylase [Alteromonas hispanica]MAI64148.1 arginine decarboxylase [Alteromonas sp.]MAI65450.1 arginine decarboxylase [Alteromonas sp.]NDW21221.1 arginine decarboxylase [Alteromonas hispanica]